jgi:pyruvate/2-oxoglutarate/acetoin dehydrogenase E1 component
LKASIRDDNPVLFLEDQRLYSLESDTSEQDIIPIGRAQVVRQGADLTAVSLAVGVHDALAAAEMLAPEGVDIEVVDLPALRPLGMGDGGPVRREDEPPAGHRGGFRTGGWATGLVARLTEVSLEHLDGASALATPPHPVQLARRSEDALPRTDAITASMRQRLGALACGA